MRVFSDRLVDDSDRKWFNDITREMVQKVSFHFLAQLQWGCEAYPFHFFPFLFPALWQKL